MSGVTCNFSCFYLQNGGACRGRVSYQRGLPRLVLVYITNLNLIFQLCKHVASFHIIPKTKAVAKRADKTWEIPYYEGPWHL